MYHERANNDWKQAEELRLEINRLRRERNKLVVDFLKCQRAYKFKTGREMKLNQDPYK